MGETEMRTLIDDARSKGWADQTLVQRATELAREVYAAALSRMRAEERAFHAAAKKLAVDEESRRFVRRLCEVVLHPAEDSGEQLKGMIAEHGGVPTFFSSMARLRIRAAVMAPRSMQGTALGELKRVFRSTVGELVLPTHMSKVSRRAEALAREKMRLVLRPLSPRVFGQKGAERYENNLLAILTKQPGVGVAVEPLRLCPALSLDSPEYGAQLLAGKLQRLLQAARQAGGSPIHIKTRCSDTLGVVMGALKRVLSMPDLETAEVSVELPAYLKTSLDYLRDLTDWATMRAGRAIRVLLVKGDYLEEQRRCSARYGSQDQLCHGKAETDMYFIRLLEAAMACPEQAITPVVGTHEVMHLSYAALLWARSGREGLPPISLIHGLGNHVGRVFAELGCRVDLVAGVAAEESETRAFERYLLRTLHELARPDSYLAGANAANPAEIDWSAKAKPIMAAHSMRDSGKAASAAQPAPDFWKPAGLSALTERAEVDAFYAAARAEKERAQELIPLRLGERELASPLTCIHRSLIVPGLEDYRYAGADYAAVDAALAFAERLTGEPKPGMDERAASLCRAARELKKRARQFVGALVRDAGFTVADAAAELRDAQEALRYAASQDETWRGLQDGAVARARGVVAVATGSAHPLAEAADGIAAAWMGGNTIVYVPATYSALLGALFSGLLRECGVQLITLPCADAEIAQRLVTDHRVSAAVCAAVPQVARHLVAANPDAAILASPAMGPSVYLAESCDWERALREVIAAAFCRSGQASHCPHILMVHASLCDDAAFCAAIEDAVASQEPRPTWLEGAQLGPVSSPLGDRERKLLSGESSNVEWWVAPRAESPASQLWSPGLCAHVQPQDDFVRFGQRLPVLGIVRVSDAREAAVIQMRLSRGSSAVIYSEDEEEIATWRREVDCRRVGVNCCPSLRHGAFPMPMCKTTQSAATGPMRGLMSGVVALCHWEENERPSSRSPRRNLQFDPKDVLPSSSRVDEAMRLSAAADSISYWWEKEFSCERPLSPTDGLQAVLRYCPERVCLRIEKTLSDVDVAIMLMAAMQTRSRIELSAEVERDWLSLFCEQNGVSLSYASKEDFEASYAALAARGLLLRAPGAGDEAVARAATCGLRTEASAVLANGRLELMRYLEERVVIRPIERIPQE